MERRNRGRAERDRERADRDRERANRDRERADRSRSPVRSSTNEPRKRQERSPTTLNGESWNRASIADQIKVGLESVREVMQTGTEDIPVLDPLEREQVLFDLQEIGAEGTLDARDVVVAQLSSFIVNDVRFAALARRVTFELVVPALVVTAGHFNLNGSAYGQELKANGTASLTLYNIGVSGSVRVRAPWSGSGVIQIYDTRIQLFMSSLRSEVEDDGSDDLEDDINEILEDLVPKFIESHERAISKFLNPKVENTINKMLQDWSNS